ncbi:MAG TPA: protein kinase [Enhygromyxa sp.]|nr:protein kinase [Enhygromyxa sp.]
MQGTTTRQSSEDSVADPRAVKARLFGDEEGDRLHKQLLKARLLRHLQQPTGGADTHEDGATEPIARQLPESPVRIGRYAVLRKLGHGGMGVVYVAYDEDLDRKVAIKLLHGELSKDDRGRVRMLREAQALARLSHPNVVQVHEVGQWSDHDYVAMEYVDGQTLDRWLAERPRSWQEVLEVLIQAGRGLEAAHAAELVHRDFKPANLLIGRDGRARVVDFGLARATNEADAVLAKLSSEAVATTEHDMPEAGPTGHDLASSTAANSAFSKLLTVTGAVLGTPAYMAPEQHLGQLANALSDQFSFCVVLYEALYGERPFKGSSRTEYAVHVTEGKFAPTPASAGVPLWLRKVVMRGLAVRPEQRWPSMTVLLAELGRDRTRNWRSAVAAGGVLVAFGLALLLGADEPKLCEADPASVADTWGAEQREAVRVAFDKTGLAEAGEVLAHTVQNLDDYAEALVDARAQTCEARWIDRSQTDAQMELRHACLEQRERELAAVVEVLADADRDVVLHSPELIAGLGDVGLCGRVDLLEAGTPAPKDAAAVERIAEVRRMIADAHAARHVGRIAEAKALTQSCIRAAERVGFEPLKGAVHHLAARNARLERDFAGARSHLLEALEIAERNHNPWLALEVWLELALIAAETGANPDEALEFRLAEVAIEEVGRTPGYVAVLNLARGVAHRSAGRHEEALQAFNVALDAHEGEWLGSTIASDTLVARAASLATLGRMDEARADLERIVATRGSRNRAQLDALFELAVLQAEAGKLDRAERDMSEALRGYAALFGPRYDSIAHGHLALAKFSLLDDDVKAAAAEIELALAILDENHPDHGWALDGRAAVELQRNEPALAEQTLRAAIALQERTGPHDEARLAYLGARLGTALSEAGKLDEAAVELDRAIAHYQRPESEAPLDLASVLLARSKVHVAQGAPSLALGLLERALELTPASCGNLSLAGKVRLTLAETLNTLHMRVEDQRTLAAEAAEMLGKFSVDAELVARARELSQAHGMLKHE